MKTERTSVSANYSKRTGKLYKAVAAICWAAAFFFNSCAPASAIVAKGVPPWLEAHVLRGLSAVWEEIPQGREEHRLNTLSLVAQQLFSGYGVTVTPLRTYRSTEPLEPMVTFEAQNTIGWRVVLTQPELRPPVDAWFAADTQGLPEEISAFLEDLPIEALSWADAVLKERIGEIVERRLPGWDFSLLVRLEAGGGVLQLACHTRQPLVLAVTPSIFSSTLPVMFQSDLTAKLIPGLSPIIGLPVAWIARHSGDVEMLTREFLEERNSVTNTRSKVEVSFVSGQVSQMNASVESERFIVQLWLAAYAGVRGRYPEAGVLLGWNTRQATGVDLELYNETTVDVSEFEFSTRLGLRFPLPALPRNFRVGAEIEWPDQEVWYRAWWDSERIRRPYFWWRYSADYGHNAAVGYRVNEHISVEIHYDNRYNEKIGLRGVFRL